MRALDLPSIGTRKKVIGVLSTVCNAALERELIARNPFRGLGPDRYAVMADRKSYKRFDADQLTRLFDRTERKETAMLWVPRLLLLTGARLEEMAQLRAEWITTRDGVPVIDLHEAQVKSPHNLRYIPLHRHLIDLGLLEYVAACEDRLFPRLRYRSTAERWGGSPSTRLNREIDEALGKSRTLTVHSLRKTFEHAAYVVGIQKPTFNAITGHKPGDISEEHYLHLKDDVIFLKKQIDLLDFSFLFAGMRSPSAPLLAD
ncbi:tyrosine-type recombinase/integrase [Mesorhizobium sp. KR2-14]|uniref:tyrosine-type recombinase/integrase n=1 Tax=Mesorhizobium sp. KR2-14 TaxID=3156610 RepID=UPI0032B32F5B